MKKIFNAAVFTAIILLCQSCSKNCNCLSADGDTICRSEYESYPQDETWEEFVAAEKADGATCSN